MANNFKTVIEKMTADESFRDKMQKATTHAAREALLTDNGLAIPSQDEMNDYLADPDSGPVYVRIPRLEHDVIACVCFAGAY